MPTVAITITLNPAIDQTVLLDILTPGAVHRARSPEEGPTAGGKGINAARVLTSLGVRCAATGWLGADNAATFEAAFARHGILDDMVRVPGATRCNLKLTDLQRRETTEIDFAGIALDAGDRARAEAALQLRLSARLLPGAWALLAGSLPPGADVAVWHRLVNTLGECGVPWVADLAAAALEGLLALVPMPFMPLLVKPNREELQALAGRRLGGPSDIADAAQWLLCRRGVRHVLVSLGAEGVVAIGPDGRWHAPAPPVTDVVSTSGAGDTLLAGTLAAWDGADGAGLAEAARFGMACATHHLSTPGMAWPPREVLDRHASHIALHPV